MSLLILLSLAMLPGTVHAESLLKTAEIILSKIEARESSKDVKCWTTFGRFEGFVAGSHLSSLGFYRKNNLVENYARRVWERAQGGQMGGLISTLMIKTALQHEKIHTSVDWKQDILDYHDYTESYRVLLNITQDPGENIRLDIETDALEVLAGALDVYSVTLLKKASGRTSARKAFSVEPQDFDEAVESVNQVESIRGTSLP